MLTSTRSTLPAEAAPVIMIDNILFSPIPATRVVQDATPCTVSTASRYQVGSWTRSVPATVRMEDRHCLSSLAHSIPATVRMEGRCCLTDSVPPTVHAGNKDSPIPATQRIVRSPSAMRVPEASRAQSGTSAQYGTSARSLHALFDACAEGQAQEVHASPPSVQAATISTEVVDDVISDVMTESKGAAVSAANIDNLVADALARAEAAAADHEVVVTDPVNSISTSATTAAVAAVIEGLILGVESDIDAEAAAFAGAVMDDLVNGVEAAADTKAVVVSRGVIEDVSNNVKAGTVALSSALGDAANHLISVHSCFEAIVKVCQLLQHIMHL